MTATQIMFVCNRLDTWESEQMEWLETVKVLRHHQGKLASVTSSCNCPGATASKKRKVDVNAACKYWSCHLCACIVVNIDISGVIWCCSEIFFIYLGRVL